MELHQKKKNKIRDETWDKDTNVGYPGGGKQSIKNVFTLNA